MRDSIMWIFGIIFNNAVLSNALPCDLYIPIPWPTCSKVIIFNQKLHRIALQVKIETLSDVIK